MGKKQAFVLVCCGKQEYLDMLRFSLAALRRFSRQEIYVITDQRRNAFPLAEPLLIDVPTPAEYSDQQAALFLKTSLHRYLPPGRLYAYLDADVVAVQAGVDQLFSHFQPPVLFCTDHCSLSTFTPRAIVDPELDGLLAQQDRLSELFFHYLEEEKAHLATISGEVERVFRLRDQFSANRPLHSQELPAAWKAISPRYWPLLGSKALFHGLRLLNQVLPAAAGDKRSDRLERWHQKVFGTPFQFDYFLAQHGLRFDPSEARWFRLDGSLLFQEDSGFRRLAAHPEFSFDPASGGWRNARGQNISQIQSSRLIDLIRESFGVEVTDPEWQHWNGGVFLFDESAASFLDRWHEWTLSLFGDPRWKPRDQGTLVAAVWAFGLQQHPTLPIEFNLIADYYHPELSYLGELQFALRGRQEPVIPCFVHIYHHFGDRRWALWRDVEERVRGRGKGEGGSRK